MRKLLLPVCSTILISISMWAQSPVDLIATNGKIWTESPRQPEVEAVAVRDGRIVAVGDSASISKLAAQGTRIIDLKGRRVVPGFNDAHVHFFWGGQGLASVQLRDATSEAECRKRIGDFARTRPKGEWILDGNWDHEKWNPARLPTHELIDDVTP